MFLKELEKYDDITIQCHDNPDADALASGYGLYCYYKDKGKNVKLIYSGKNQIQKSNLLMMVEKLSIPVEYMEPKEDMAVKGLLITTDCQYGQGNVTKIHADVVAVIDHHQDCKPDVKYSYIQTGIGSCSTIVWNLLNEHGFEVTDEEHLGTALYYGLYTDTNQFSELFNPVDKDAMDGIVHDKSMITVLKNCNLSLRELEIAGIAILRYTYNEELGFGLVHSQPCDPNILGLISDFLLQVDKIDTCLVYNETTDGIKLSVRSCIREVNASELAEFLCEDMGSGGGHFDKAGGFINQKKFEESYPGVHTEAYFNNKMMEYFEKYELVYASKYEADISTMKLYMKNKLPIGVVKMTDVLSVGMPITVRTMEGDMDLIVEDDLYVIIGVKGEVYPIREEKLNRTYKMLDKPYVYKECVIRDVYVPTIKNRVTGKNHLLTEYAKTYVPTGDTMIYARPLTKGVKVFTAWDQERYMLGKEGDYLALRTDDFHDVYVVEKEVFGITYSEVKE